MIYALMHDEKGKVSSVNWTTDDGAQHSAPLRPENLDCLRFLWNWKIGADVVGTDNAPMEWSDDAVRSLGLDPSLVERPMFGEVSS